MWKDCKVVFSAFLAQTQVIKQISNELPSRIEEHQFIRHLRIEPEISWFPVDFRELWAFRDLFSILAMRDVKLRYKQTFLGVTWVILQPLVASLIFAVIFGRIASLPSDGERIFVVCLCRNAALVTFLRGAYSVGIILIYAKLITKVYFPRLIIPIASSAAVLIDFVVAFIVLLGL